MFVNKLNDYFWDSAADPLIDGFRKSHPTVEDTYRRAFELSLTSLHPAYEKIKAENPSADSEYDWFGKWDFALKNGIPFDAHGMKLPKTSAEADATFKTAMERLAAMGTKRREGNLSITTIESEPLPKSLLNLLKEGLPGNFDQFFRDLLVKPENATALNEATLDFHSNVLVNLAELKATTTATHKMVEFLYNKALAEGKTQPQSDQAKDAVINRLTEELEKYKAALTARPESKDSSAEQDEAYKKAIGANDFDAALRIKSEMTKQSSSNAARDLFDLGRVHEFRFEWPQALDCYRQAWRLSHNREHGFQLARLEQFLNHHTEAIAAYEAVVPLYSEPGSRAQVLNNLGNVYTDTHRIKDGNRALNEAVATFRGCAQENPDVYLPLVATGLINLAGNYFSENRLDDAEGAWKEALSVYQTLARSNQEANLPRIAAILINLGALYFRRGRLNEAEAACDEAVVILRNLAKDGSETHLSDLAMALDNRTGLYAGRGQMKEARSALGEAISILRELAKANPDSRLPELANALNNLVLLDFLGGRLEDAINHAVEARRILTPIWEINPSAHGDLMARIHRNRAEIAEAVAKATNQPTTEACALARRALAAALDPALKQQIHQLIDRLCPGS